MTIKEYADGKGVTRGAIYKAIGRAGYSSKDLTDKKGHVTPKGSAILSKLFPDAQNPPSEPPKGGKAGESTLDELREQLSEAQRAREKAEDALATEKDQRALFEKLYYEAKDDLKRHQEAAERERTAFLERISELTRLTSQQQELARISSMNPVKRLFSDRKRKRAINTEAEIK